MVRFMPSIVAGQEPADAERDGFGGLFHLLVEIRLCHRPCPFGVRPGISHPEADTDRKSSGLWTDYGERAGQGVSPSESGAGLLGDLVMLRSLKERTSLT
ncbi:hypothetical protein [Streptomyces decoyicus]|uniref:hypothetical protein n=1 Tax=Streptomyces decoyicus TaxID=249567 RepID=UPI00364EBA2F